MNFSTWPTGIHIEAFRDSNNTYSMIYLPIGKAITINVSIFKKNIVEWWLNPKDASAQKINITPANANMKFTPPTTGIENDWVLVLDDVSKNYGEPGKDL